jgi:plastocyanin
LLVAVGVVACGGAATAPAPASVSIKGFAFAPATIEVAKGTTVTWKNDDTTTHTVTSGANRTKDNKFDNRLETNATATFTFDAAGTYEYFCQIHSSMKATVMVK